MVSFLLFLFAIVPRFMCEPADSHHMMALNFQAHGHYSAVESLARKRIYLECFTTFIYIPQISF